MSRKLRTAVTHWLARELADAPDAEGALAAVFARWPATAPPAGLVGAVLQAAGLVFPPAGWLPARALGWAFAAGLLLAVPALSHLVGLLLELGRSGQLAALAARSMVGLGQGAAVAGTTLAALVGAGEPLVAALRGPSVLGFCLAAACVALAAFWRLQMLLVERSGHHA
jgi:hypothetical protein